MSRISIGVWKVTFGKWCYCELGKSWVVGPFSEKVWINVGVL